VDRYDRLHLLDFLCQFGYLDTLRQRDIRQVHQAIEFQLGNIDIEILRQILRQTDDFNLIAHLRDGTAALFDAWGNVRTNKVNRYVHANDFIFNNTLKIEVHDAGL